MVSTGSHRRQTVGVLLNRPRSGERGYESGRRDRLESLSLLLLFAARGSTRSTGLAGESHADVEAEEAEVAFFAAGVAHPVPKLAFQGEASVHSLEEIPEEVLRALFEGLEMDPAQKAETCILEVRPRGRFLTYGVGVSLSTMRVPERAHGQVSVSSS